MFLTASRKPRARSTLAPLGAVAPAMQRRHAERLRQAIALGDPDLALLEPGESPDDPRLPLWRVWGRCTATARARHQGRCRLVPVLGATVCEYHGGAVSVVKDAARRRLMMLQMPAIYRLAQLIDQDRAPAVALAAATAVLDRTGLAPERRLHHSGQVASEVEMPESVATDIRALIREAEEIVARARQRMGLAPSAPIDVTPVTPQEEGGTE